MTERKPDLAERLAEQYVGSGDTTTADNLRRLLTDVIRDALREAANVCDDMDVWRAWYEACANHSLPGEPEAVAYSDCAYAAGVLRDRILRLAGEGEAMTDPKPTDADLRVARAAIEEWWGDHAYIDDDNTLRDAIATAIARVREERDLEWGSGFCSAHQTPDPTCRTCTWDGRAHKAARERHAEVAELTEAIMRLEHERAAWERLRDAVQALEDLECLPTFPVEMGACLDDVSDALAALPPKVE